MQSGNARELALYLAVPLILLIAISIIIRRLGNRFAD
jgi:hypothetical protein